MQRLAEDYGPETSKEEIRSRSWYGRCVYEADNDVCEDQHVVIKWEDDPLPADDGVDLDTRLRGRTAKTANFHMIAQTEKQCERRGTIYGTQGEITYDSKTIRVFDFASGQSETFHPPQPGGGHGGGDEGLAGAFIGAIDAVKNHGTPVATAQMQHIGCDIDEIVRSHAVVFAAEEARNQERVVQWKQWWEENVGTAT